MNPFRQLLDNRGTQVPIGTWVMSVSPLVAEAIGNAGFDWCVLDMEHTPLDLMSLVHMLQAVGNTKMVPMVRVPWNDTVTIKRVLDAGAHTLLVPFVQNADEARAAVAATRYPPEGVRGMAAMGRASRFGTVPDFFRTANQHNSVIVQIETPQAAAQVEAIAAVPGVDGIFLGPADLSGALGYPGQLTHPDVMALMASCAERARKMGKPVGSVGGTPEVVARYREIGCDFVAIASDLGLLMRAAQAAAQAVRAIDGGAQAQAAQPAKKTEGGY